MLIEKKYQKRLLCPCCESHLKTYNALESHLSTEHYVEVQKEKIIFKNMTCKFYFITISNKLNVFKKYKLTYI